MLNESVKAKLVDDIEQVLTDNEQEYKSAEIIALVNRWYAAKEPLINLLRKHPNWNENAFAVVFDCDSVRSVDENKIYNKLREKYIYFPNHDLYRYDPTFNWVYNFAQHTMVMDDQIEKAGYYIQTEHPLHAGKTTRVLNKIFTDPNWDFPTKMGTYVDNNGKERNEYDRWFAELSDLINPMKVTRHTLLSVHPCDYLNMSRGTGWASCHNIYDGEYMAGTLSYMCDKTSMIFYTVRAEYDGDCYWNEEKINRQVYCYSGTTMLQSRLYPRYNDYENIEIFRNAVQNILATCLGVPNRWILKKGVNTSITLTCEDSTHYPDYEYDDYNTNIAVLRDHDPHPIVIGSVAHCLDCCEPHTESNRLRCMSCTAIGICTICGHPIQEGEFHYTDENGNMFCGACCYYCEGCQTYHSMNVHYHVVRGYSYCNKYYEAHKVTCSHCGRIYMDYQMHRGLNGESMCASCLNTIYPRCFVCGERHEFNHTMKNIWGEPQPICEKCYEQIPTTHRDGTCSTSKNIWGESQPTTYQDGTCSTSTTSTTEYYEIAF